MGGVLYNLYQRNSAPGFEAEPDPALSNLNEATEIQEPEELITVHVVGAVKIPGIFSLPEGSRVHDVVEKAGGATNEADLQGINMARPLFDGEQIIVPEITEDSSTEGGNPESAVGSGTAGGKININRASVSELTALSGIGESRARNIVSYREENGPFKTIEDIMNVPNIGAGIFAGIKEDISVY